LNPERKKGVLNRVAFGAAVGAEVETGEDEVGGVVVVGAGVVEGAADELTLVELDGILLGAWEVEDDDAAADELVTLLLPAADEDDVTTLLLVADEDELVVEVVLVVNSSA